MGFFLLIHQGKKVCRSYGSPTPVSQVRKSDGAILPERCRTGPSATWTVVGTCCISNTFMKSRNCPLGYPQTSSYHAMRQTLTTETTKCPSINYDILELVFTCSKSVLIKLKTKRSIQKKLLMTDFCG